MDYRYFFNKIFSYIFPLCPGRDVKKDGHANKSPGSQMYLGWECRNRDYKVKGVIGQKIFFCWPQAKSRIFS